MGKDQGDGIWGTEAGPRSTQHFVSVASLCCKNIVVISVRLKCIAVSEELLFTAVAPCAVEANAPHGQRDAVAASVAPTAMGISTQWLYFIISDMRRNMKI